MLKALQYACSLESILLEHSLLGLLVVCTGLTVDVLKLLTDEARQRGDWNTAHRRGVI